MGVVLASSCVPAARWEELRIQQVELGKSARVGNENGSVDDKLGTAAARAKHRLEVPERLSGLFAQCGAGGLCCLLIDPWLPGDEQEITGADGR